VELLASSSALEIVNGLLELGPKISEFIGPVHPEREIVDCTFHAAELLGLVEFIDILLANEMVLAFDMQPMCLLPILKLLLVSVHRKGMNRGCSRYAFHSLETN
jgi:hypothetical protein